MKCPNCGCTVREDREDCPFCGVILPAKTGVLSQGSEITQQMIRKSVQPNMERRINRELRRANLQHLILNVLLAGVLALEILILIAVLGK